MFEGAVTVGEELKAKISTFKNQRDTRKIGFRTLFDKLGTSLERMVKAIDAQKPLKGNIRELEMCIKGFPGTVGDIIGLDKAEELTALLKAAFDEQNFIKMAALSDEELKNHKKILRDAADHFIDLWEALG